LQCSDSLGHSFAKRKGAASGNAAGHHAGHRQESTGRLSALTGALRCNPSADSPQGLDERRPKKKAAKKEKGEPEGSPQ
jgi:hypothetical protein